MIVQLIVLFGTALPTLLVFPDERPLFIKEYSTDHYSVVAYFISRVFLEAFLSAVQSLLLTCLTYFMLAIQQPFFWFFITVYVLSLSAQAMAMMIGSSVRDPKIAIELLPVCFVPQIMFAGFFIATGLIPAWLRWLTYVFPLTYSIRIGLVHEFGRDCGSSFGDYVCKKILENVNAKPKDEWIYWLAIAAIFVVLRLGGLLVLRQKAL
jgi:ABC-2 type transporter